MLLAPFQAGLVPVHAKPQPVLVTGRYLTRPQHAAHAALVAEQNVSIVIEHTALDETAEVRRQLAGVRSRDEVDEMIGVGTDVAEAAAGARPPCIDPPAGLSVPGVLQLGRQPDTPGVPRDSADDATLAERHPLTRLPHAGGR